MNHLLFHLSDSFLYKLFMSRLVAIYITTISVTPGCWRKQNICQLRGENIHARYTVKTHYLQQILLSGCVQLVVPSLLITCHKVVEVNRLVASYSNNFLSPCNSTTR